MIKKINLISLVDFGWASKRVHFGDLPKKKKDKKLEQLSTKIMQEDFIRKGKT